MKKIYSFLFTLSICLQTLADDEGVYVPYPIIFVHGLASSESAWNTTKRELSIYFYDNSEYKYEYAINDESAYFPHCNYKSNNSGDISYICLDYLGPAINKALNSFPANYKGEKKVIVVGHSMGGLVTMSLLKQAPFFGDDIEKVVFLGSPIAGSPYASMLWSLNELYKKTLPLRLLEYKFYTLAMSPTVFYRVFDDIESGEFHDWSKQIYIQLLLLHGEMGAIIAPLKLFSLPIFSNLTPSPDGMAVEQLRLCGPVSYYKEISGYIGGVKDSVSIECEHETNSFLSNSNLSTPERYKVIKGTISDPPFAMWFAKEMLEMYDDDFIFPYFGDIEQSLDIANDTGDGIVTKESQEWLLEKADYNVDVSHIEETEQWKTILQAIDSDPPEITKIQLIPKNWLPLNEEEALPYYIIVSSEEYLLADLEIVEFSVDGMSIEGFECGDAKPYNVHGKDFLKKRTSDIIKDADGKGIVLNPGDFYAEVDITKGVHIIKLSVRNPAQAIKGGKNDKVTVTVKVARPEVKDVTFVNEESELSLCSSWCVDVTVYDETQIEYDYKNRVGNKGYAQFTVESPLYKDVKVDIDIYDLVYTSSSYGPSAIQKKLVDDQTVALDDLETTDTEGNIKYTGCFPDTDTLKKDDELQWTGTNDSGSYVEEKKTYPLRISVHSPTQDGLYPPFDITDESGMEGLTGSNWDDENGFRNDIIYAEPAFVQENRQIDLPGGLNISIELLGNINTEKDNNNLLSKNINKQIIAGHIRNNLIPILDSLVTEEIAYDSAKRIIIKYYNQTNISPKIAHNLIKFVSILRNCKIIEIRQRINSFIKDINIPNAIINKKRLWLYYKHSLNSTPVKFMICDASDNNTTGVNKQKNV